MQTLSKALIDLVLAGLVDREIAANAAPNRHDFVLALEHAEKTRAASASEPAIERPAPATAGAGGQGGRAESAPLRLVRVPLGRTAGGS